MVAKSDGSHQEGKYDGVAHNLAEDVTNSDLLYVSGVKITFEEIDSDITIVGGQIITNPCGPS